MSLNRATLIGNVGQEPELKTLENGRKVATFTIATTEKGYTTQSGTVIPDRTEWHNVVLWQGLAEVTEKYIHKGSQVYVEGKITTRSWEKDSVKHYRTEIVADNMQMLGKKPEGAQPAQTAQQPQSSVSTQGNAGFPPAQQNDNGGDLPF